MRVVLILGVLSATLAHRGSAQRWDPKGVTVATMSTSLIRLNWSTTPWAPEHVALATMSTSLILLDWSTTADAIRRCGNAGVLCTPSVEQNPLLGRSPSLTTLRAWSLAGLTGSLVGGALLRRRWMRTAWFASIALIELVVVRHNLQAGLRFSLKL
jgi:hypothetical protein